MRHVGASYERCGKAKMQGVWFEKLTDHRELLSIAQVDYSFELETGKGEGLPPAGNNPSLDSVIQPEECAPMFAGVHLYPPKGRVTCLSLAIPRVERQQRA